MGRGKSVEVNRAAMEAAIAKVEANGALANRAALYDAVADEYSKDTGITITPAVVYNRVLDWELNLKTQSKKGGKGFAPVDKDALIKCITKVEANGPLKNHGLLWQTVADEYNKLVKPAKPITFSVVRLRADEWRLEVKTPKGKRAGRTAEEMAAIRAQHGGGKRRSRAEKIAKNPLAQQSFTEMRQLIKDCEADRFLPLVDRIERGNIKAMIQLHCLECVGFVTSDVKHCTGTGCQFWLVRPYQNTKSDEELGMDQLGSDTVEGEGLEITNELEPEEV